MEGFGLGVDEIEGEIGIAGAIQFQSGEGGSRSIEAIGADIDTIGIITFLQWLEVGLHFVEGEGACLLEVEVVACLAVGTAPGKELRFLKPMAVYGSDGNYTEDILKIYRRK